MPENEDFATIADILARGLHPTDQRHPIARSGEREPIPPHVRSAIWYRDHGQCEICGTKELAKPWELDHIKPWSAGGTDRSDNLRVLCAKHNQERSNRIDPTERPRRPATWWCMNCFTDAHTWSWSPRGMPACPIHQFNPRRCRVMTGWHRSDELGFATNWHQREPIDDAYVIAYCAHCNIPSLTDRPL